MAEAARRCKARENLRDERPPTIARAVERLKVVAILAMLAFSYFIAPPGYPTGSLVGLALGCLLVLVILPVLVVSRQRMTADPPIEPFDPQGNHAPRRSASLRSAIPNPREAWVHGSRSFLST